jgi:hypothetical protein
MNSREIAPTAFDAATARVRVTSGDGIVIPYGSVVDNLSSDASFVSAALVQQSPADVLHQQTILRRAVRGSER